MAASHIEEHWPELGAFIDGLNELDGRKVTVTASAPAADVAALAEEVVRVLNTPGGPTLARRAVR